MRASEKPPKHHALAATVHEEGFSKIFPPPY